MKHIETAKLTETFTYPRLHRTGVRIVVNGHDKEYSGTSFGASNPSIQLFRRFEANGCQ